MPGRRQRIVNCELAIATALAIVAIGDVASRKSGSFAPPMMGPVLTNRWCQRRHVALPNDRRAGAPAQWAGQPVRQATPVSGGGYPTSANWVVQGDGCQTPGTLDATVGADPSQWPQQPWFDPAVLAGLGLAGHAGRADLSFLLGGGEGTADGRQDVPQQRRWFLLGRVSSAAASRSFATATTTRSTRKAGNLTQKAWPSRGSRSTVCATWKPSTSRAARSLTYGIGEWQFKFGYSHLSSHLGDEFAIANRAAWPIASITSATRWCWGVVLPGARNAAVRRNGVRVQRRWRRRAVGIPVWHGAFAIRVRRASVARRSWRSMVTCAKKTISAATSRPKPAGCGAERSGQVMRIGAHYFNGKSSQYQTFDKFEQQVGVGLWYDFSATGQFRRDSCSVRSNSGLCVNSGLTIVCFGESFASRFIRPGRYCQVVAGWRLHFRRYVRDSGNHVAESVPRLEAAVSERLPPESAFSKSVPAPGR